MKSLTSTSSFIYGPPHTVKQFVIYKDVTLLKQLHISPSIVSHLLRTLKKKENFWLQAMTENEQNWSKSASKTITKHCAENEKKINSLDLFNVIKLIKMVVKAFWKLDFFCVQSGKVGVIYQSCVQTMIQFSHSFVSCFVNSDCVLSNTIHLHTLCAEH